jgi:hypothetical protein
MQQAGRNLAVIVFILLVIRNTDWTAAWSGEKDPKAKA